MLIIVRVNTNAPNNQAFIWDENKKLQFVNTINIEKVEILSDKITSENDINIDETIRNCKYLERKCSTSF